MAPTDIGSDHCRVVPPEGQAQPQKHFEYARHLFAYQEFSRRMTITGRVLDLGSGEGYGSNQIASLGGNVIGADLGWKALLHARNKYPSIPVVGCNSEALPFIHHCFESVVSFQVIEHVPDVQGYLL